MDYRQHITAEKVFAREMLPESKMRRKRLIHRVFKRYKKVKSDDLERKEGESTTTTTTTTTTPTTTPTTSKDGLQAADHCTDDAYSVETWVE